MHRPNLASPAVSPAVLTAETFVTADDACRLWTARVTAADTSAATETAPSHGHVLIHGGPGFWDTLAPVATVLAELGNGPAVRWDQRGGGRSQHQGPYTLDRFTADLDAVRAAHGLDRVTLVGHSWGATLALHYALTRPERVGALIYISGIGLSWDWREEHNANFAAAIAPNAAKFAALRALERPTAGQEREADLLRLACDFPHPATAPALARSLLEPYFQSDPKVGRNLNAEMRTLTEAELIERCQALPQHLRTLIIDGAKDLRPRWSVDSLAAALPDVRRVTLESAGHLPWLDEPEQFAAALRTFLE